jgi:hypothetical protein
MTRGYGFGGGGVRNLGTLSLESTVIQDSSAPDLRGGGINNEGQLWVANSAIVGNSSQTGGGISNSGTMTLTNVTLSGNTAVYGGAAIASQGTAALTNVTIAGNLATPGTGTALTGAFTMRNTLITGNGDAPKCAGSVESLGYNIGSDASCNLSGLGDQNGVDPMLGPLADNGGGTMTHALLPGSPAIDAGDPNGCPATDQRGVARPQGSGCDIGAFEYEPPPPPPPPPQPTQAPAAAQPTALTPTPTTAAPTPTLRAPTRTPRKRTATPRATVAPVAEENGSGGSSTVLIVGGALASTVAAGAAGGGGYLYWRRRRALAP